MISRTATGSEQRQKYILKKKYKKKEVCTRNTPNKIKTKAKGSAAASSFKFTGVIPLHRQKCVNFFPFLSLNSCQKNKDVAVNYGTAARLIVVLRSVQAGGAASRLICVFGSSLLHPPPPPPPLFMGDSRWTRQRLGM